MPASKDEDFKETNRNNEVASKGIHYSPHHAVVRRDRETTKVRVVYDGSAKNCKDERSLNDCLEVGENHIPLIFEMLTNFRWNSVALTADIEKAFLMVGIKPEDRDMLRFLWLKDPLVDKPEIVEYRFNRLVFGLRPSPSILGETIAHHLNLFKQSEPEMFELLSKSLYVDDLLTGEDNDERAFTVYQKSKKIMASGGFNLRKWNSNSPTLLKSIQVSESSQEQRPTDNGTTAEDDESYAKSSTTLGNSELKSDTVVKVLGMNWDTIADEFFFNFSDLYDYGKSLPATKRSVLKFSAKIFDPIGFLTPCTIEAKIFFQELCLGKVNWDSELDENLLQKWNSLLDELKFLGNVRIPRCYFSSSPVQFELHGFSDASSRAYAGVVYLRSLYEDGRVDVRLVASKARVAPLKRQTIPRLELLGALILSRLVTNLQLNKNNMKTVCWTDSMTTLCWIRNERPWKQYVQHRVDEIRKLTSKNDWRHCPGKQNPADLPSRGVSAKELSTDSIWWNGPNFLYKPESQWPASELTLSENEVVLQEAVKNPPSVTHSLVNTSTAPPEKRIDQVIEVNRFNDLTKLLRVTALVLTFVRNVKNKARREKGLRKDLKALDLNEAEELWIKALQASSFAEEIKFLRNSKIKVTPPNYVSQFGLFLDNGIIKCKGRLNNSNLPSNSRNPILLPAKHQFVRLVIKDVHELTKHSGIRDTLVTSRERFWILRGREAVKQIIRKCVICRRYEGTPYRSQPSSDLPSERVSEDPPFTHVGLDFAGPLFIAEKSITEGTSESSKVYVCLFTCASTRAVHLELTRGLNVQAFLLAFRRFASRRGLPATLNSDNAKTFKSSCKEIRKITRAEEVWRFLTNKRIVWNFIIERAPWWGGYWERLVQSIKRPLKKVLGRSTLNFDELNTVLVEIESVINSRPITYVYDDKDSNSCPLTPSDLIYGRRISTNPNASHQEIMSTYQSLTRRLRHHKNLLQQLTNQWRREYLTSLRERRQPQSRDNKESVSVGDLVVLKNDSTSRIYWKLAKVEELIYGADGKA